MHIVMEVNGHQFKAANYQHFCSKRNGKRILTIEGGRQKKVAERRVPFARGIDCTLFVANGLTSFLYRPKSHLGLMCRIITDSVCSSARNIRCTTKCKRENQLNQSDA